MSKKRKPFVRPPVVLPPCRGCGGEITPETVDFRHDGVWCRECGIFDPVGIGRPRIPGGRIRP